MRRSQRLSSMGTKSLYFDNDVGEPDSLTPQQTANQRTKPERKARLRRRESSPDELEFDNATGNSSENEDESGSDSLPAVPGKRGRPAKTTSKKDRSTKNQVNVYSPRKRVRGRSAKVASTAGSGRADTHATEDNLTEVGKIDSDDEFPHVEFIPLPKLRDAGGVEYEPQYVHPNTMAFLKDLKANNQRSWLKMRDPEFRRSLKDWDSFVETLTDKIIESDETIPELPLKDIIFRIYRDIRFSKDPTPYKPHYSAAWSRTGRKGPYACYYVHCEPGSCFVGGGLWHPDKDALAKLRANIDERPHRLRRVLMNPSFRRAFLPKASNDEASVVAAFCESNQENALKTRPQGFNPEHRDIELLKLRNYTVGQKIKDSDLISPDAQDRIMAIIEPMVEYVTFLNSVVMPDPNFDSDSDTDGEDGANDDAE